MERRKVLLVDHAAAFCEAVAQRLRGDYEIRICGDGREALSVLEHFQPQVLVTDLMLPGLDGISLMKAAASGPVRPAMLAVSCFETPYIAQELKQIGADYLMLKPCNIRSMEERIRELSGEEPEQQNAQICYDSMACLLLALSVPTGRKGYRCLETLIELYREDPGRSLTKDLYPTVGRTHDANGQAVERAIRGVIETAWENRDDAVWRQYFSAARNGMIPKPTNREFISAVAMALRECNSKMA